MIAPKNFSYYLLLCSIHNIVKVSIVFIKSLYGCASSYSLDGNVTLGFQISHVFRFGYFLSILLDVALEPRSEHAALKARAACSVICKKLRIHDARPLELLSFHEEQGYK